MATLSLKPAKEKKPALKAKKTPRKKDEVHKALSEIQHQAKHSASLWEQGVEDSFAALVKGTLEENTHPLMTIFNLSSGMDVSLIRAFNDIVCEFLKQHKETISKAFKIKGEDLYYFLVLHEDTPANRREIYRFLQAYENTQFAEKFPLYFHFVPEHLIKEIPDSLPVKL